MNIITSRPSGIRRLVKWLVLTAVLVLLILLFAQKITQLALPGLGVGAKTAVIDPKCPTPEQKELIEQNLNLYGAGFAKGYDNSRYAQRLLALARTLGYPEPKLDEINSVIRFLREALQKNC